MDSPFILAGVLVPLMFLIGLGVVFDRLLRPDLVTLTNLNFYLFVPALAFTRLYASDLGGGLFFHVVAFSSLHLVLVFAVAWGVARLTLSRERAGLIVAAALFNNCGNYGIPFAELAFGPFGAEVMSLVLVFQNVVLFTLGAWLLDGKRSGRRGAFAGVADLLRIPVIPAVLLALGLNLLGKPLPAMVVYPLEQLAGGLVPVALLTLGVQLSRADWRGSLPVVGVACGLRLVAAPALALALALAWRALVPGLPAAVYPVLVCGAGLPAAVNLFILAAQRGSDQEVLSRIVFWSTILSLLTLAVWIPVSVAIFGK